MFEAHTDFDSQISTWICQSSRIFPCCFCCVRSFSHLQGSFRVSLVWRQHSELKIPFQTRNVEGKNGLCWVSFLGHEGHPFQQELKKSHPEPSLPPHPLIKEAHSAALFRLSNHSTQQPPSICCTGGKGFVLSRRQPVGQNSRIWTRVPQPQCGESYPCSASWVEEGSWVQTSLLTLVRVLEGGREEGRPGDGSWLGDPCGFERHLERPQYLSSACAYFPP